WITLRNPSSLRTSRRAWPNWSGLLRQRTRRNERRLCQGNSRMKTAQMHWRLQRLSEQLCPADRRSGTLEDFCRRYWRMDPGAFRSFVQRDCPAFSVFLTKFEFEDTARVVE